MAVPIPRILPPFALAAISSLVALLLPGCGTFIRLGQETGFLDRTRILTGHVENADDEDTVYGLVFDWDRATNEVVGADFTEVGGGGVFGFFVEDLEQTYICAFSDRNGNRRYDTGEPAWIHRDPTGRPAPLRPDADGDLRATGRLSSRTQLPADLVAAARRFADGRPDEEVRRGWNIPVTLGEVADLDDPRFSAERGSSGFWKPASYPIETGVGIHFTEKYDASRTPVIFVYGAAGSPQDWRTFMDRFDRRHFQHWFYQYPSGMRLAESGGALDRGIRLLRNHYDFGELHIVAHSMGGLVSRHAIIQNLAAAEPCVGRFVSISSPYGGAKFAESGVRRAPAVIPSWRDMVPDSPFQQELFETRLKGKVDHLLIYGDRARRALTLPAENDGSVSVASVTRPEAVKDAVRVERFHEDHVSILSNPDVIRRVESFLLE